MRAPGCSSALSVPTLDQVVAVAEEYDVLGELTYVIIEVAADKTVLRGGDTADSIATMPPGHGPAIAAPVRTLDQVVAVAQDNDAMGAHSIEVAADKGTEQGSA